jgi:hypothetical protein
MNFRKSLKKMRLTVKDFSKLIGFTYTSVTRWNSTEIPYWVGNFVETLELLPLEQREKFFQEKLGEK